jgi:hypothetical protein
MKNGNEKQPPKNNMEDALVHLAGLPAIKMADDQKVADKFIDLYNKVHGNAMGKHIYDVEKFHFMKQISESKDLQNCSKLSLYGSFIDVAVQGLSFDPTKKLCYLIASNHNVGTKDNPIWEKRAALNVSPYGELYLRQYYGQILSADNPVIVYEGDEFDVTTTGVGRQIRHKAVYPRKSNVIIACFMRIVKNDGTIDFGVLDQNDVERLKAYSERRNKGKANELYGNGQSTGIDAGFLIAKTIKHSFKAYPKVRLRGQFTQIESEQEETETPDYGLPLAEAPNTLQQHQEPDPDPTPTVMQINTANASTAQMTTTSKEEDEEIF